MGRAPTRPPPLTTRPAEMLDWWGRTGAFRLPGDDAHRADFGLHRAARNGWILRENRLDLRPLAQVEDADAERVVAYPGWPRDDKLSFVVHLPQVSPVRLEHLPLLFDPVSGWSKDDEEAHEENLARSPPCAGWAAPVFLG